MRSLRGYSRRKSQNSWPAGFIPISGAGQMFTASEASTSLWARPGIIPNARTCGRRAYNRIGYTLCTTDTPEKQTADAIYDSDSYRTVFEQDLREAAASVVISSPTLSRKRVEQLLNLVRVGQENGLKVAVITWHPDVYRYGKDEHRLALLESLRMGGCDVRFAQDNCLHFAVIDETVVWYGSMNLLSRDDVEDNIMRLESREIAEELLGTL